jgi:Xaa-Pro dipeptidase
MSKAIVPELSFPVEEYRERLRNVRSEMAANDIDVALVHAFPHVCYLTGFQTFSTTYPACCIVPREGDPSLVLCGDELANARLSSWIDTSFPYARHDDPVVCTVEALTRQGLIRGRIGMEEAGASLSYRHQTRLRAALSDARVVDGSELVPRCMVTKSAREIACIKQAAAITAWGMRAAVDAAVAGGRDTDVACAAHAALIGGGSEFMCVDPVVCAGVMSGIPHGRHTGKRLNHGDTILLEMAACRHRYSAPVMRTVSLGPPGPVVRRMAEACRTALDAVIAAMKPGALFADVAAAGATGITAAGPSMIFHGTYAYSIGLGFPPTWADCPVEITKGNRSVLTPGMVFHLPMSLRDEGAYGTAFSETVAITDSGCDVLTDVERRLFVR